MNNPALGNFAGQRSFRVSFLLTILNIFIGILEQEAVFLIIFAFFEQNAGRVSLPYLSAYSVTKYGVEAFSDALRREMYPWGVQVSIVEPGGFKTNINVSTKLERDLEEGWQSLNEELKEEYGEELLKAGTLSFQITNRE